MDKTLHDPQYSQYLLGFTYVYLSTYMFSSVCPSTARNKEFRRPCKYRRAAESCSVSP